MGSNFKFRIRFLFYRGSEILKLKGFVGPKSKYFFFVSQRNQPEILL
ncbi:hypothetical protein AQPE_2544 [Aquipluma nitroreducens]|uniref:Uncharacterized protein n=1 Tax=Aquipluma nitroreducens TaxID=2010828 RepID=A0A5K7S9Y2_9BACT|nr:hypothetical protein AQPE_2544 [Aquipluma nitroreducens]